MSNVMSQGSDTFVTSQSKLSRGSAERKWTALCQLVCGVLAIGCGIILIPLESPLGTASQYGSYETRAIEIMENTAVGIWGGLIFVTTAVLYIFGRKNNSMVGVYFGLCILSVIISLLDVILSIYTVGAIIEQKYFSYNCELYADGCCFSKNNWRCDGYDHNHYNYYHYNYDYSDYDTPIPPTTPPYNPLTDYKSPECQSKRITVAEKEQDCLKEIWRLYGPHQIVLGILIAVLSVEFFVSAYGACASIVSLCDCSWTKKRKRDGVVYFPGPFGQPVNGSNHTSWMMVPVSAQPGEQGMISPQPMANFTVPMPQSAVPSQTASDLPSDSGDTSPMTESTTTPQPE
ncbi:hypothetical protein HOLleu_40921 [Holothuria leucospilota]|uniref:Uncharacterized protein n=1 Tax=Holothuria leucospilota TaxID=206669 RepID=A0A9Q1BDY8_HOLLE|nr:hypothetical protein HOLleu_40921 [Holothuria leucospilota]